MKYLKLSLILILVFSSSLFAEEIVADGAAKVLDIIFLGAKVVGAIAIVMGINEMFIEKDPNGQQGKKESGTMKVLGGILLMSSASVIGWMIGL